MRFRVAAHTDVGQVRSHNEDAYLIPDDGRDPRLVAVADGVGGHNAGEVASALALEVLESWTDRLAERGGSALEEAVLDANRTVWSKGQSDPDLQRMGTTLTAAWREGSSVTLAHVGDSRAYLLRGDELEQLTVDQTLVQQLVDEGRIDEEEAARHPQRNIVLQAIGSEPEVRVEMWNFDLRSGDRLMLATDGLHGAVPVPRIKEILAETNDPDEACRILVDEANEGGGHDNITVLILDAEAEADEVAPEEEATGPVIVSKPPMRKQAPVRNRNRMLLAGVLAVVVIAGVLLVPRVLRTATTRYIVTEEGGSVVIMRGTPGSENRAPEGQVVERTDVDATNLPATYQRQLSRGIAVDTLEQAQTVVESLPRPAATPTPVPPPPPPTEPQPQPPPPDAQPAP